MKSMKKYKGEKRAIQREDVDTRYRRIKNIAKKLYASSICLKKLKKVRSREYVDSEKRRTNSGDLQLKEKYLIKWRESRLY